MTQCTHDISRTLGMSEDKTKAVVTDTCKICGETSLQEIALGEELPPLPVQAAVKLASTAPAVDVSTSATSAPHPSTSAAAPAAGPTSQPAASTSASPGQLPAVTKSDKIVVHDDGEFAMYLDTGRMEHMFRVARVLATSTIVPPHYRGNEANCLLALNMSLRLRVDPFMFMQKTSVINDKLGFEAQLITAIVNTQMPFKTKIQYEYEGEQGTDAYKCTAWAIDKDDRRIEYPLTVGEARKIGNAKKNDNWIAAPKLMITYRAATYLVRLNAPEILMGMATIDELVDVGMRDVTPANSGIAPSRPAEKLSSLMGDDVLQHAATPKERVTETVYTAENPPFSA